jgi:hypothetical protein
MYWTYIQKLNEDMKKIIDTIRRIVYLSTEKANRDFFLRRVEESV